PHARSDQTQPLQPALNGAHTRHPCARMLAAELAMNFLGAPMRAAPAPAPDSAEPSRRQLARRADRAARTIAQAAHALATKTLDPLVSGRSANARRSAQLLEGLTTS